MIPELKALFDEDFEEHGRVPPVGTPEYRDLRARDERRRQLAEQLLAAAADAEAVDLYHVAWLLNHGDTPDEAERAHRLALRAAHLGHRPARWLSAAAYDRWQLYRGLPQKYGTQIVPDGVRYRLWDLDGTASDEDRARWDVPPLSEMERRAEEQTRRVPQPPLEDAPSWLKAALPRWNP